MLQCRLNQTEVLISTTVVMSCYVRCVEGGDSKSDKMIAVADLSMARKCSAMQKGLRGCLDQEGLFLPIQKQVVE